MCVYSIYIFFIKDIAHLDCRLCSRCVARSNARPSPRAKTFESITVRCAILQRSLSPIPRFEISNYCYAIIPRRNNSPYLLRKANPVTTSEFFYTHASFMIFLSGETRRGRVFPCKVCGKLYMRKWSMYTHQRLCGKDPKYVCVLCGKKFKYKHRLQSHLTSRVHAP